jgi:hypothetical protein
LIRKHNPLGTFVGPNIALSVSSTEALVGTAVLL